MRVIPADTCAQIAVPVFADPPFSSIPAVENRNKQLGMKPAICPAEIVA
jgi:hypothetical protein